MCFFNVPLSSCFFKWYLKTHFSSFIFLSAIFFKRSQYCLFVQARSTLSKPLAYLICVSIFSSSVYSFSVSTFQFSNIFKFDYALIVRFSNTKPCGNNDEGKAFKLNFIKKEEFFKVLLILIFYWGLHCFIFIYLFYKFFFFER